MKTAERDPQSYFAIIDSFLKQAELSEREYLMLTSELRRYLTIKLEKGKYVHPMITKFCTDWYREFYRLIGFKDPYKNLKIKSNVEASRILPLLDPISFEDMLKISVKGNQLDYGAVLVINPDITQIEQEFKKFKELAFTLDDSAELKSAIENAKNILFLPDNAGEIIFDIPLLKYLNSKVPKNRIKIAAKETPMLNDVTISELKELGIDQYGTLISTGSNCFGLHEEDVSMDFKRILKNADLIIAKGQAYLEFFTEYNFNNIFNITRIKYPVINEALGMLEPHQNVILSSKRYQETGKSYEYGTLHPKIIKRDNISEFCQKIRNENKTIVTANGSFDIMHLGHIRTLEDAKKQGDVLIVGINSDDSVKKIKGPDRPINDVDKRKNIFTGSILIEEMIVAGI